MENFSCNGIKRKDGPEANESDSSSSFSSCSNNRPKRCKTGNVEGGGELKCCHQCKRNDKGGVVNCSKCKKKRYCISCISRNYPQMNEDDFAEACPSCRDICNCKSCLRLELPIKNTTSLSKEDKSHHSKYLLKQLLPFVRQFNEQQIVEREIEAKIRGLSISDIKVEAANIPIDERLNCNFCGTSIADYHRSCRRCLYDLCIACCQELRNCCLDVGQKEMMPYVDPGVGYLHGEKCTPLSNVTLGTTAETKDCARVKPESEWKANEDGSIPCPPESMGGCGEKSLKLKQSLPDGWLSNMLVKAQKLSELYKLNDVPETPAHSCSYFNLACDNIAEKKLRRASYRDNSDDNYLYSPSAKDIQGKDLNHFQAHWSKGQPVIISNVLESTYGLSWEPMVMSRAICEKSRTCVNVVNCLNWCEEDYTVGKFFRGYTEGVLDLSDWPQMQKLNDWPPSGLFEEHLPRHNVEFISALPFKEYTHPRSGYLNLAVKLPNGHLMPDIGPKLYAAYGFSQELGRGDSVTKITCHESDVVYVLTHTQEMTYTPSELAQMKQLKERHYLQDQREIYINGEIANGLQQQQERSDIEELEKVEGGSVWDIFRREDASKLREYLRQHFKEFRHTYCLPLKQVFDPIHDGAFYLNTEHKRRLQQEYGIEPWTVVQNLGDAVFIPAGCPCQVRNLESCIQVSTGFVSPENVGACIRLSEEIRVLPQEHGAKEDKLGVKKLILHAMRQVLDDLDVFTKIEPISCKKIECVDISSDSSKETGSLGSAPEFYLESDFRPATQNIYARRQSKKGPQNVYARRQSKKGQIGDHSPRGDATPIESDFQKAANISQEVSHVITNPMQPPFLNDSPGSCSQMPRPVSVEMVGFFKQLEEQIQENNFDVFRKLPPQIHLDEQIIQEYEKALKKYLSRRLLDLADDSNFQDFNKVLHFLLACRRIPSHLQQGFLTLRWDLPNLTSRAYELHKEVNRGMVLPLARSKEKEDLKSMLGKFRQVEDNLVKLEKEKDANLLEISRLQKRYEDLGAEVRNLNAEVVENVVGSFYGKMCKDRMGKLKQMEKHTSDEIARLQASNEAIDVKIIKYADEAEALHKEAAAQNYKVINLEALGAKYEANIENAMNRLATMELKWRERAESLEYRIIDDLC